MHFNNTSGPMYNNLCNESPDLINSVYSVFLLIIIFVNFVGNSLVCICIRCTVTLRSRPTYMFLFSLAVTDILTGLLSLPIRIKQSLHNQLFCMPISMCWFHFFSDTSLSVASIMHLLAITIDRHLFIQFPYDYESIMTRRRVYVSITVIWIYSLLWTCLNIFDWTFPNQPGVIYTENIPTCSTGNKMYFTILYVFIFLLPMLVMFTMYSIIYKTAVRHTRAMSISEIYSNRRQRRKVNKRRQMKSLKSIVIVCAAFCICWLPNIGVSLSGFWDIEYWQDLYVRDQDSFLATYFITTHTLPALHSTLNPFIYVLFNAQLRQAMLTVWGRMCNNVEQAVDNFLYAKGRGRRKRSSTSTTVSLMITTMNCHNSELLEVPKLVVTKRNIIQNSTL